MMINFDFSMKQSSIAETIKSLGINVEFTDRKSDYFLTVLTRTQGLRPYLLKEVMLCLMAQDCDDFEWIIAVHRADDDKRNSMIEMVNHSPYSFNSRVRILDIQDGNRTRPLNVGFEEARGRYVSVLDDDDIVLAHWVSEFKSMAESNSGKVLRTMPLWQDYTVQKGPTSKEHTSCSVEAPRRGTDKYDFWKHFYLNESPIHSLAFPSAAFQEFGINFNEELNATEDWDFLLRTVSVCGIYSSAVPTSIYRKFRNLDNSNTEHNTAEWMKCYDIIQNNLNNKHFIIPPGNILNLNSKTAGKEDVNEESAPNGSLSSVSAANSRRLFRRAIQVLRNEGMYVLLYKIFHRLVRWRDK